MTAPELTPALSPALSEAARRFLEAPRFGIVATLNPDGSPLQAVVWYRLESNTIVFNSRVGRRWPSNLQRDARVSITVADAYDYVEMRGLVEIDEDPQHGQAVIAQLAHRYMRDRTKAEASIEGFRKQRRVTFRLRPERVFERFR
jgi:PPOX class probable F420-dependent enzyme